MNFRIEKRLTEFLLLIIFVFNQSQLCPGTFIKTTTDISLLGVSIQLFNIVFNGKYELLFIREKESLPIILFMYY